MTRKCHESPCNSGVTTLLDKGSQLFPSFLMISFQFFLHIILLYYSFRRNRIRPGTSVGRWRNPHFDGRCKVIGRHCKSTPQIGKFSHRLGFRKSEGSSGESGCSMINNLIWRDNHAQYNSHKKDVLSCTGQLDTLIVVDF